MRPTPIRLPRSRWRQGQALRLQDSACGIRPGSFVFLKQDRDTFQVRRLADDGAGDLCATDESHDLPLAAAANFLPAMSISRI